MSGWDADPRLVKLLKRTRSTLKIIDFIIEIEQNNNNGSSRAGARTIQNRKRHLDRYKKEIREELYEAQQGKCSKCGWPIWIVDSCEPIHIHHRISIKLIEGNNDPSNLELVHEHCHEEYHKIYGKKYYWKFEGREG